MECGKWQLLSAFLLCCIQLPITFSDQLLRSCARTPPHRCRTPIDNSSLPPVRPVTFVDGRPRFASCELYVDPEDPSLGTQHCSNGWEYLQDDPDEWTLVTEVSVNKNLNKLNVKLLDMFRVTAFSRRHVAARLLPITKSFFNS